MGKHFSILNPESGLGQHRAIRFCIRSDSYCLDPESTRSNAECQLFLNQEMGPESADPSHF